MNIRPAHETKHIDALHYPVLNSLFTLVQSNDGTTNGTTLWLGGQAMAIFLADLAPPRLLANQRPRAIELGSGIGMTALALCSLGWDVVATDEATVYSSVLSGNIANNLPNLPSTAGVVQCRELDWTVHPSAWTWSDAISISAEPSVPSEEALGPPFDLIFTSDTLYSPALIEPLLRTIHALVTLSTSDALRRPPCYLCLERRDPQLVDQFFEIAKSKWSFDSTRIPHRKLAKLVARNMVDWEKDDWEGVEIWKLVLPVGPNDSDVKDMSSVLP
ncbi:hypothetical protein SISNIDRAFT_447898 [Sistotremastrum niveocremeum HHB9708]|uniref:S-adenosyl-L-methionine-dependent methyltransferase n=1 Tax=Sistotremastrum niveocremeum HHB9708 TaxID=1314777 RepID=A0A165AIG6_9AGAM|nr:hypothetical protein SISNIDRAFT_447898 [Sistotremastrum niveocremeum HHB9708]